ncbi:hypothetical protein GGU11DRAFT_801172 [Lentinula aff. detonsa]|nr:hypothetical protein GGU11DRAFT_801172 [Lentinula aff. detonsa]
MTQLVYLIASVSSHVTLDHEFLPLDSKMSLLDWVGVNDPWIGVNVDLVALQSILRSHLLFSTSFRAVIARLVAPVKPLFKTEGQVAVMNFVQKSSNSVGTEWLIMEYMSGVELDEAWDQLQYPQKQTFARNLIDVYDQLFRLKTRRMDNLSSARRSPRWQPLSLESLRLLRSHCNHSIDNGYELGPLQDISLIDYRLVVPSPSQTMPTFTSEEYFKLVAFNGNPPTRSDFDLPTQEKCLYFVWTSEPYNFYFSCGDLHEGNILIDPQSGAINGIVDWEAAGFRPLWAEVIGDDTAPEDIQLRAFIRHHLHKKNPDLFSCFVGGPELRAVLHAAVDDPSPIGETDIFLCRYHDLGYWKEGRREMKRVAGHGDFETLWTDKWGE